ncbi:MAG: rhodocoxin [Amycolatopsis sp.]|jgi:2Fe-2S ferredoxin|uniref:2Fe-2S iron-sulfur cluster-binding protein n=1 Tax=Amycolatopsis sp. TaxID=37632 RepID=UPI00262FD964|nr:2Fe-2S iron-sulfur cluster-binding protein [Amycolatopsis sp.]MCU1684773.1 rhodocoxin [Amycolatopsis sp.]
MPKLTFIQDDGVERTVDAALGGSVMQAAVDAGVNGIVAQCGGNVMCATCHVYADPGRLDDLGPMCSDEDEMLDCTASPREVSSRLSCQVTVTEDLDGLVLRVPEEQE